MSANFSVAVVHTLMLKSDKVCGGQTMIRMNCFQQIPVCSLYNLKLENNNRGLFRASGGI